MNGIAMSVPADGTALVNLNRFILSQRGKPFTRDDIVTYAENEHIETDKVDIALGNLFRRGVVVKRGDNFYVPSRSVNHRMFVSMHRQLNKEH
jgi:hypothetical protein